MIKTERSAIQTLYLPIKIIDKLAGDAIKNETSISQIAVEIFKKHYEGKE